MREIFRALKQLIIEADKLILSKEYKALGLSHSFENAWHMIENSRAAGAKKNKLDPKKATIYEKVQYWFSHKAMEKFFKNQACNFLFRTYAGAIWKRGKELEPGRNKEKVISPIKEEAMKQRYRENVENLLIVAEFFFDLAMVEKGRA